ncbi:hypothetical protein, partial [Halomarina rubra]
MTESSVLYATPDPTSAGAETVVSTLTAELDDVPVTPVATVEGCRAELDAAAVGAVVVTGAFDGATGTAIVRAAREHRHTLPVVLFADDPSAGGG